MSNAPDPTVAFLAFEPGDETIADQVRPTLEELGLSVVSLPRDESAAHRAALADKLEHADLVIALWTQNSASSHWLVDEAEIGSRRGVLVSIEAGASAPIGIEAKAVARLSAKPQSAIGRRLQEPILRCLEELGYRSSKRIKPIRFWSAHTVDALALVGFVALLAASISARRSAGWSLDHWQTLFVWITPATFLMRWLITEVALRMGLPFRAYGRRVALRWLGESLGTPVALLTALALNGALPALGVAALLFLGFLIWAGVVMMFRAIPLFVIPSWRFALLA